MAVLFLEDTLDIVVHGYVSLETYRVQQVPSSSLLFAYFTTWTVFWQPADAFADRLSTILTVFLAAVAFLYVIATALPQLSYLTTMGKLS